MASVFAEPSQGRYPRPLRGTLPFVIAGLSAGCKKAFVVDEPAATSGSVLYFPPSGPPAELAGLTKDGVTRVQVVLNAAGRDPRPRRLVLPLPEQRDTGNRSNRTHRHPLRRVDGHRADANP
jgi:hypothetical protein